jgi:uncharacterized protein (DUF1330 family)
MATMSRRSRSTADAPHQPRKLTSRVIDAHPPSPHGGVRKNAMENAMTADTAKPGRGYIYVEMTIKEPEGFKAYAALSAPAVHAAGGRYIVMGARPEFLEGAATDAHRIVLVEFDTAEQARGFYHSAAYQAARQKRLGAADFRMTLLDGPPQG